MKTNQELLDLVTEGIATIITSGQSWTLDTGAGQRTFSRANLQTLRTMKSDLEAEVARDAAGGVKVTYGVPQ